MKVNAKTRAYLRFSLGVLRYKPLLTVVNVACNAVIFSYGAALAYLVRLILNSLESGVRGNTLREIAGYLAWIIAASLVRAAAIMACSALDSLRSYYYQNRLRSNIIRLLYRQDDMTKVAGNSGRIFELADDDIPACVFPPELLTEVTGFVIYTVIAIATLLSINWQVTLFIFIPLSAAIYGIQKLSEHMKERRKANREAHDDISDFVGDVADCVLAIKTADAEEAVLEQFGEKNRRRTEAVLSDVLFGAKTEALLQASVSIGIVIMMFIVAQMLAGGTFRIGDFSIFVGYLGTLADCTNRIIELIYEAKKAEVSYERILGEVGEENCARLLDDAGIALKRSTASAGRAHPRIAIKKFEAKNLSFSYGENDGFRDVSFTVGAGELVVIVGGVGSGKSTLLGVLSGYVKADSGVLLWNDTVIDDYHVFFAPPNVACSPQRSRFFSADIGTNICLGHPAASEDLAEAVRLAALEDTVAAMEDGFHTFIGNRGDMLSGGQRQRLALARMFVRDAELNVIDDCVSALDEHTQFQIRDRLVEHIRRTGHSAIIATNSKPFLLAADKVIVMKAGCMIADGSYAELSDICHEVASVVA